MGVRRTRLGLCEKEIETLVKAAERNEEGTIDYEKLLKQGDEKLVEKEARMQKILDKEHHHLNPMSHV